MQQTVSNIPENIVQDCVTSDIWQDISAIEIRKKIFEIAASCKLDINNIFLRNLNVNSLRNKFEFVNELIKYTFDVFLVDKSKLDSSVSESQFPIPGYRIIPEN